MRTTALLPGDHLRDRTLMGLLLALTHRCQYFSNLLQRVIDCVAIPLLYLAQEQYCATDIEAGIPVERVAGDRPINISRGARQIRAILAACTAHIDRR